MGQFLFGLFIGAIALSVLWLLYIAYFSDEVDSLGYRVRRWLKSKLQRRS